MTPRAVGIEETQRLVEAGAQLVDVLPAGEYQEAHIPGSVNVPLKRMTAETTALLDRSRPVIVYCHDYQ